MSEQNGTTTALVTINTEEVQVIISQVPEIISNNRSSVEKAKSAGQALLYTIQAEGMSDELDERANNLLVKIRKTNEKMNNDRKPITQILDLMKKEFTTLEAELDPETKGGIYSLIQAERDKYATDKAAELRRKEEEARKKLELDKELIRLESECKMQLAGFFNAFLSSRISKLNELFNTLEIGNFESQSFTIKNFSVEYPHEHFESFAPQLRPVYASQDQINNIIIESTKGKFGEFIDEFRGQISLAKQDVIDRLASRKRELEQIEAERKKNAEKAAEMEKQAKARQEEEERKRKAEEAERLKAAEAKIETSRQADMTEALFESQVTIQEAPQQSASVRERYEIEVLNPLGYLLIAQFYFEHEGKIETVAKLEKKTLGSMKKFCESYAMKNDEKINSPFLKYNEKFKTIAKKA